MIPLISMVVATLLQFLMRPVNRTGLRGSGAGSILEDLQLSTVQHERLISLQKDGLYVLYIRGAGTDTVFVPQ